MKGQGLIKQFKDWYVLINLSRALSTMSLRRMFAKVFAENNNKANTLTEVFAATTTNNNSADILGVSG